MIDMEAANETVSINTTIADRVYPLKVLKSDEEKVMSAVNLVNEKLKEYQKLFNGKDRQDYMAMCLLSFATEQVKLQGDAHQTDRLLEEKLKELEGVLSGSL